VKRPPVGVLLSAFFAFFALGLLTLGLSGCGGNSSQSIAVNLISSATGTDQGLNTQFVFLPASVSDTNPSLLQFEQ
jgi:hypothetical protein